MNVDMILRKIQEQVDESRSVLKYTLLIPELNDTDKKSINTDDICWPNKLYESLFRHCRSLVDIDNLIGRAYEKKAGGDIPPTDIGSGILRDILFPHCVESVYLFLRSIIGDENHLTTYYVAKYQSAMRDSEGKETRTGLDYLISHEILTIDDKLKLLKIKTPQENSAYSRYGKAVKSRFDTLNTKLGSLKLDRAAELATIFENSKQKGETIRIPLDRIDLSNLLIGDKKVNSPLKVIRNFHESNPKQNKNAYFRVRKYYHDYIYNENHHTTECDRIFLRYELEHLFQFELAECLSLHILAADAENIHFKAEDQRKLCKFVCLPNYSYRDILLQYFFDHLLQYKTDYLSNFYAARNEMIPVKYVDKTQNTSSGAEGLDNWLRLFELAVNYLGTFLFPLMVNLFFNSALDVLSEHNDTNTIGLLLQKMYTDLSALINSPFYLEYNNRLDREYRKKRTDIIFPFQINYINDEMHISGNSNSKNSLHQLKNKYQDVLLQIQTVRTLLDSNHGGIQPQAHMHFFTLDYLRHFAYLMPENIQNYFIFESIKVNNDLKDPTLY